MQLQPCAGCRRHVQVDETRCPFCAAGLGDAKVARDPLARLSRAAVFVAAAATSACGGNKTEPKHVDHQVQASSDAGVEAPAADAAPVVKQLPDPDEDRHYQNHPCVDTPQGPMCAPYGAPPARRRIV